MSKLANEKGLNSLEVSFRGRGNDMSVMGQNHQYKYNERKRHK